MGLGYPDFWKCELLGAEQRRRALCHYKDAHCGLAPPSGAGGSCGENDGPDHQAMVQSSETRGRIGDMSRHFSPCRRRPFRTDWSCCRCLMVRFACVLTVLSWVTILGCSADRDLPPAPEDAGSVELVQPKLRVELRVETPIIKEGEMPQF